MIEERKTAGKAKKKAAARGRGGPQIPVRKVAFNSGGIVLGHRANGRGGEGRKDAANRGQVSGWRQGKSGSGKSARCILANRFIVINTPELLLIVLSGEKIGSRFREGLATWRKWKGQGFWNHPAIVVELRKYRCWVFLGSLCSCPELGKEGKGRASGPWEGYVTGGGLNSGKNPRGDRSAGRSGPFPWSWKSSPRGLRRKKGGDGVRVARENPASFN